MAKKPAKKAAAKKAVAAKKKPAAKKKAAVKKKSVSKKKTVATKKAPVKQASRNKRSGPSEQTLKEMHLKMVLLGLVMRMLYVFLVIHFFIKWA